MSQITSLLNVSTDRPSLQPAKTCNRKSFFREVRSCFEDALRCTAKIAEVALPVIAGVFLGATAGFLIGIPIGILGGAVPIGIVGGVVGGCIGIAIASFILYRKKRRLSQEILSIPTDVRAFLNLQKQNAKVVEAVTSVLCSLDGKKKIVLKDAQEHYALHRYVTVLTDQVKENPQLKKPWEAFLRVKRTVVYPDERKLSLDFTAEIHRLNGDVPGEFTSEVILAGAPWKPEDFNQALEILSEGFTGNEVHALKLNNSEVTLCGSGPLSCILIRDKKTSKILGMLFYQRERQDGEEVCAIACVGRRVGSAYLGIGEQLFQKLFQVEPKDLKMQLQVRSRNIDARALYDKMGFKYILTDGFYELPSDEALLLQRDGSFGAVENTGT